MTVALILFGSSMTGDVNFSISDFILSAKICPISSKLFSPPYISSATPPEKAYSSIWLGKFRSAVSMSCRANADFAGPVMTSKNIRANFAAIFSISPLEMGSPILYFSPRFPITFAAGSSMRQIIPSELTPNNRPPTDTQLVDIVSPFFNMAMFEVPPPISQDNIVLLSFFERPAAPEPMAAIELSKLGPAVAATNRPASLDNASAICLAFCFRADSPVTMTAPLWISAGSIPAR